MNLSFFIANRIAFNKRSSFSAFIVRIAITAVTLSVAVMIIGTAVTQGYQHVISQKFYDCWGHIHVTNFLPEAGSILNDEKIEYDSNLVKKIEQTPGVKMVSPYSIQSAIFKTKEDMDGILLKGIQSQHAVSALSPYLIKGSTLDFKDTSSNEILISEYTSKLLSLNVSDKPILYFITKDQYQPKARKVKIKGIFKTGLEDYDKLFAICNASLIQEVNNEDATVIQGYEVYLITSEETELIQQKIYEEYLSPPLQTYTLQQRFSSVFSWLSMMKVNERIIIIIMMIIAVINMITALLILILERTQMVGIFKSIGMSNSQIRSIFIINSLQIAGLGILFGSILGISICLLQQHFGFFTLNESTYYVKQVPIYLQWTTIIYILLLTFITCFILLLIPSYIIKTIRPVKALKFN
jgi:lipoprotein-releasing system permease protein